MFQLTQTEHSLKLFPSNEDPGWLLCISAAVWVKAADISIGRGICGFDPEIPAALVALLDFGSHTIPQDCGPPGYTRRLSIFSLHFWQSPSFPLASFSQ